MIVVMLGVLLSALAYAQQALPPLAELKAAAERGDPIAQDQLGDVFQKSLDNANAEKWYRQAAAKGVVNSQYRLGHMLMVQPSYTTTEADARSSMASEAIGWFVKAANQGHRDAQLELGDALKSGRFIKQDYVEAYKWYTLARKGVATTFMNSLRSAQSEQNALILKMTQAQIAEGQKRAAAFVPHVATGNEMPEPAFLRQLKLIGISGQSSQRLAMINNKALAEGESASLKLGAETRIVRCVQIKEKSVVVSVGGIKGDRELHLP
jgi:hypothetical protein